VIPLMTFYTQPLPRCGCGKGATVEVLATGCVLYDRCCDRCGARRVKELQATYDRRSAAEATPGRYARTDDVQP